MFKPYSQDEGQADIDSASTKRRFGVPARVVLCVVVAVIGVAASLAFWAVLRDSERHNANRLTKFAVDVIEADVMEDLGERVKAMARMSRIWATQSGAPLSERRAAARAFISQNHGSVSLHFIDKSYHLREVVTSDVYRDDNSPIGRDMRFDPDLNEGFRSALERREWVVVPGKLLNGNVYDRVVVPVQHGQEFCGFVVLKVDVKEGLADVLKTVSGLGYTIIVRKEGHEIYAQGNADRALVDRWGQQTALRLAGGNWTILAVPEPVVLMTFETQLPTVALALGATVTTLLVLVLSFTYVISKRSQQIQSTNAELRSAIDLRRSIEDALRGSEARFSGILEMSTDAIVSTDEFQKIALFNKGAENIFGFEASEVIGKRLDVLLPSRFHGPHDKQVQEFSARSDHERSMSPVRPVIGRRKDGTEFPIEASISKLTLNGKKIYTAILRDVTERLKAEELLRQMHSELEKRVHERTAELEHANIALQEEIGVRNRAEAMLSQLSGRLLVLQDEERRRIARELHDSTAQYLFALTLNISSVKSSMPNMSPEAAGALTDALELLDRCSSEIRTMSYLLHPPLLDELGLVPALEWYAAGFTKRSGVMVQLELPPKNTRISAECERTLFRIVQECLSNVHRHSGASEARIWLVVNENEIRMDVSDDGKGIKGVAHVGMADDVAALLGVGVAGMRERVRQLGGHLEVSSSEKGTIVTTILSISKAESAAASEG